MRTWAMTGLAGLMLVLLVANVKADYYDDYLVQDLYKRLSQVNPIINKAKKSIKLFLPLHFPS